MWFITGNIAIIAAVCNWVWAIRGKNPEIFRFISLSSTALTVCSFNQQFTDWMLLEDWGAMKDCIGVSAVLWVLVIASILINGGTLVCRGQKK